MHEIKARGAEVRATAKRLVLDFMRLSEPCQSGRAGLTQSGISRECDIEWGDYPKAEASRQQYWVVAILRELEKL
jgi:hypothetical protein